MKPSAVEVVDYLTYRAYVFNRESHPEVTVRQWQTIFCDVSAMESRYQATLLEVA